MRRREGHALKETEDMRLWKKEFEKISLKEHDEKLKSLGLDDEDIEEFNEEFTGGGKKKEIKEGKEKE